MKDEVSTVDIVDENTNGQLEQGTAPFLNGQERRYRLCLFASKLPKMLKRPKMSHLTNKRNMSKSGRKSPMGWSALRQAAGKGSKTC